MSNNGKDLVLTTSWDDGHPLDLRIAEALAKYGLHGTFYVPLENSRPILSSTQIRDLSSAFEIGAHTVRHRILTELGNNEARCEIVESKARIEEMTGKACQTFCFPSGRFTGAHVCMLREAGFSAVRTVELLSLDFPRVRNGIAMIPTTVQAHQHSLGVYIRNGMKRRRVPAFLNLRACYESDWGAMAMALLRRAGSSGGVFHLWGHSWEIEETQQWQALERVLEAMAETGRSACCAPNGKLRTNA